MNQADVLHYEQIQDMLLTDGWKNVHKEGTAEHSKSNTELATYGRFNFRCP